MLKALPTMRSLIVFMFAIGSFWLAVTDPSYRPSFKDLGQIALGGYLGQMLPQEYGDKKKGEP